MRVFRIDERRWRALQRHYRRLFDTVQPERKGSAPITMANKDFGDPLMSGNRGFEPRQGGAVRQGAGVRERRDVGYFAGVERRAARGSHPGRRGGVGARERREDRHSGDERDEHGSNDGLVHGWRLTRRYSYRNRTRTMFYGADVNATDLIALVDRSPAAVAAHDREAWLDIFARDAAVNDPVGSRSHVGRDAISRFYATFIEPNEITFDVDHDIVCGDTVVRDLTVRTAMSTGAEIRIPMHLRYELADENGTPAVRGLFAHWELPSMVLQLASAGMPGAKAVAVLAPQLLANQGVSGALGFSKGFIRVGAGAKRITAELLKAIARFDEVGVHRLLADAVVELPGSTAGNATALLKALPELRWSKSLAAGRMVTVSIEAAGEPGLALFEFDGFGRRIKRVRIYR
jgi:uncharacterized protein (TIGR02246 family)